MKEEFQEIYDLWKTKRDSYESLSTVSKVERAIDEAQSIGELINAIGSKLTNSYAADLHDVYIKIATDYPQTHSKIEQILFKREIAKIMQPKYTDDYDVLERMQKAKNIDEIIDATAKIRPKKKAEVFDFIKEKQPDKVEKLDLISQKEIAENYLGHFSFREKDKADELNKTIARSRTSEEFFSGLVAKGASMKYFNIFGVLHDIQAQYPQKTEAIQQIFSELTKAETYEKLNYFYAQMFNAMYMNPERYSEYLALIKEQLSSDKNDRQSLDVVYEKLNYLFASYENKTSLQLFLTEHPKSVVDFVNVYITALKADKQPAGNSNEAASVFMKVIDIIPEQSMDIVKIFYNRKEKHKIISDILEVLEKSPQFADEYLDFIKADSDLGKVDGRDNETTFLSTIIKNYPQLATKAEEIFKQIVELNVEKIKSQQKNPSMEEDVEASKKQLANIISHDLRRFSENDEQSLFALGLVEYCLNNLDDVCQLNFTHSYVTSPIYVALKEFAGKDRDFAERCLNIVQPNLEKMAVDLDGLISLLKTINFTGTPVDGLVNRFGGAKKTDTPKISDRVLSTLNKLWATQNKEDFFKESLSDDVVEILKDIVKYSPEKTKACLPIMLEMYKYSKHRETKNAYELASHLNIISTMMDFAPKTIEVVLPDLKKNANFYDRHDKDQCEENLNKIVSILQKGIEENPELIEKALPIIADIKANEACPGGYSVERIIYTIQEVKPDDFDLQWQAMQICNSFTNLRETVEQTEDADFLKKLVHKKEEAYGKIDFEALREIERLLSEKNYIAKTLEAQYPNRPLAEQLIEAAYEAVNSGDEQKKKEFNEFILSEGEPRLSELDSMVMDYLHENCTQNNLDKVNALRSFYSLKVELKTGNTVDLDERTAVRKVFDRTWSSYERIDPRTQQPNPYYETSVSPAYKKYFEEHDIYKIYYSQKTDDKEKKYSMQKYFDALINQSSFKALRKHGLYNDMKIICQTLEALQVEPEIAAQFNLKDLSDMVVNSHNTQEDRKVYSPGGKYMFTRSPHTDELSGRWRDPYYWHQDEDDDVYNDEFDNEEYKEEEVEDTEIASEEKQFDEEGFEISPEVDDYSEAQEEFAARDSWWEDLALHNPKAVKSISEALKRHGRTDEAIAGFWEAAAYGTPGVGSRRDERYLSATLHHAEAIQYGGNDDKNNFTGAVRLYDSYGETFTEDNLHIDYHQSFHRRDTPFDALYVNPEAKSAEDKLAIADKPAENAQKAFLITSFTNPHMHFYAGYRKQDQYTAPLYKMTNIEKEKQERVKQTEEKIVYLSKLGEALSNIADSISEVLEKKNKLKDKTESKTSEEKTAEVREERKNKVPSQTKTGHSVPKKEADLDR